MNNACTVDLQDRMAEPQVSATGFWNEEYTKMTENLWGMPQIAKIGGIVFSLATSSVTAIPDPWLIERRRRDATVTVWSSPEIVGRPISRSEALRMARQILEQAEQERLDHADFEAVRGIQWGEES